MSIEPNRTGSVDRHKCGPVIFRHSRGASAKSAIKCSKNLFLSTFATTLSRQIVQETKVTFHRDVGRPSGWKPKTLRSSPLSFAIVFQVSKIVTTCLSMSHQPFQPLWPVSLSQGHRYPMRSPLIHGSF